MWSFQKASNLEAVRRNRMRTRVSPKNFRCAGHPARDQQALGHMVKGLQSYHKHCVQSKHLTQTTMIAQGHPQPFLQGSHLPGGALPLPVSPFPFSMFRAVSLHAGSCSRKRRWLAGRLPVSRRQENTSGQHCGDLWNRKDMQISSSLWSNWEASSRFLSSLVSWAVLGPSGRWPLSNLQVFPGNIISCATGFLTFYPLHMMGKGACWHVLVI